MKFIYNLSIRLYNLSVHLVSPFNKKAKLWVVGRRNIFNHIQSKIQNPDSEITWFHCASLGEFEQGRPLIEKIKSEYLGSKILLTFFSPSGYETRKNYSGADYIFYLPIDTPANVKQFVELIKPAKVFFIKYEFWFNYLNELKRKGIPTYLVSGIFRTEHYFFKWYSSWFRNQLKCFTHFYLQDEQSKELLNAIGYTNTTVSGDTRFDRVLSISQQVKSFPLVELFKQEKRIFIVGSSWPEDEKLIADCKFQISDFKLIIAPHEIDKTHIQSIVKQFSNHSVILYSQANEKNILNADVLVIDNIGMLSSLYKYATIAFIGGGFGKGIHNILEAAAFSLPVIFGPNYHKFAEAKELIRIGGAFSISNSEEFKQTLKLLNDKMVIQAASHIAKNYVHNNAGASEKIIKDIF